jgi:hypothetical protein
MAKLVQQNPARLWQRSAVHGGLRLDPAAGSYRQHARIDPMPTADPVEQLIAALR